MDLTDEQWETIRKFVPGPERERTTEKGRLITRFERKPSNFLAFLKLRCMEVLLRRL